MDTYKTINSPAEGIYKEKGSKFLSFVLPVNNAEEVKVIVTDFRKRYFDARHICYAYMIGSSRIEFRVNDDGEPSGTAGRPIMGQINSHELTNIIVIVVRYFGGILLGTGGLATAYKEAAIDAISNAQIVEKTESETIHIQFDYIQLNKVMQIVKEMNPEVLSQHFDNLCSMQLSIRKQNVSLLISKFAKIIGLIFI